MRFAIPCMLALWSTNNALGPSELDELFARWAATQKNAQSLIIEFGYEVKDSVSNKSEKAVGTLRWIRTLDGEVFADYEIVFDEPVAGEKRRFSALLNGGNVYLLDHRKKSAQRFDVESDYLVTFLMRFFNPVVMLLDRDRAETECRLKIVKKDKWYTYLSIAPGKTGSEPNGLERIHRIDVALMRGESNQLPKGMPRAISIAGWNDRCYFEIKSWQMNPENAPKEREFLRPEDRPGWEVVQFPFYRKKNSEVIK